MSNKAIKDELAAATRRVKRAARMLEFAVEEQHTLIEAAADREIPYEQVAQLCDLTKGRIGQIVASRRNMGSSKAS